MKALYVPVLAATALFSISGVAFSQTWQAPANADPQAAPGATSTMSQPNADPSRMNRYENDATGPQPGGSSGSGRGRNGARCTVGLSCDIYQGS